MKYKRWHQPLRNRVPLPKLSSNSRVVNVSMMERVTSLVKGGVMHKPLWYDAMLAHPPPKKAKAPRPMRLEWEDDRLRRLYLARNPAATLQPKALFLDPRRPEADMEHEADAFVRHQKALMRKGATEEEAYRTVRRQQQEAAARAREEEERVAQQQAAEIGARRGGGGGKVPYSVTQQLFRRLAEEAREAGAVPEALVRRRRGGRLGRHRLGGDGQPAAGGGAAGGGED